MSELCEICGHHRLDCFAGGARAAKEICLRAGYERALARADRYEAEFSACKALLIAAQQRGERAEAERAEAERKVLTLEQTTRGACDMYQAAEQRASEARALALEEAAQVATATCSQGECWPHAIMETLDCEIAQAIRALAALPVEPARRQVTEITQEAGTPRAPKVADLAPYKQDCACGWYEFDKGGDAHGTDVCFVGGAIRRSRRAEPARCSDQPAPQNPPPSPTGDSE
jgi:hypothetical protein